LIGAAIVRGVLVVALAVLSGPTWPTAGAGTAAPDDSVQDLAKRLSKERDKAEPALFERLAELGGVEAFDALADAFERLRKDEARTACVSAIARFGGDDELRARSIALLRDAATEGDGPAPVAAARGLAAIRPPAGELPALIAALERVAREAEEPDARRLACDPLVPFLGDRGGPDDKRLILAAASPRFDVDQPYLGVTAREAEILAEWTHYEVARRALASGEGPESRAPLIEALADRRTSRAWKLCVLDVLADVGGDDVDGALLEALGDDDPAVVLETLAVLGGRDGEWDELKERLRPLQKHPEAAVRRAAVVRSGQTGLTDPEWRAEALDLARSSDEALRMGAASALAEIRTPEAMEALHGLLGDKRWPVRVEALRQTAKLRRIESVPVLIGRMEAESGRFRDDAHAALRVLTGLDHGRVPERWRRWWDAEGATFELPDAATAARAEDERRRRAADDDAGDTRAARYFGVHVTSERQVFVLDVSGSMRLPSGATDSEAPAGGRELNEVTRMDVAKRELADVLRRLPDDVLFNVVFFESRVTSLEKKLVRMKKATRQKALRFVLDQYAVGGTALYPALELAFADPLVDTIYLLSDGAPTEGELTDVNEIRAEVRRWNSARHVRIHGVSMGQDSTLLRWLCEDTGGRYLRVD